MIRDTADRILIVDDNVPNIALAQYLLQAAGHVVDTASGAEAALSTIASTPPALVLMDIQLPGTDGLDLTRRLKADPSTRHIVVVAFTAYAMRQDAARMLAGGCDGYIAKPIDAAAFADTVAGLLAEFRRPPGPASAVAVGGR